jgi:hypothetical protein
MIEITPHPRKNVRCDIAGCKHPIKPLWVNEKGAPMPLRWICCETHLKEIISEGRAYFGISDDPVAQFDEKNARITELEGKMVELNGRISELETINKSLQSANHSPKGRSPKTMKGKGGKR